MSAGCISNINLSDCKEEEEEERGGGGGGEGRGGGGEGRGGEEEEEEERGAGGEEEEQQEEQEEEQEEQQRGPYLVQALLRDLVPDPAVVLLQVQHETQEATFSLIAHLLSQTSFYVRGLGGEERRGEEERRRGEERRGKERRTFRKGLLLTEPGGWRTH